MIIRFGVHVILAGFVAGAIGNYYLAGSQDTQDTAYYTGVIFVALLLALTV